MSELAALFVLSPSRTSLTSSRCLQARPDPFYSPWAAGCLPPAFRHSAHASLCFASGLEGLQPGNLLGLSGAKHFRICCSVRAGAFLRVCRLTAQQWHDAVLVLRLWVPPRPGLQRGCRRDVSLLLYSFVRSFQVVLSERGALVGGSQPLRDRSLGGFEDTWNLCKIRDLI